MTTLSKQEISELSTNHAMLLHCIRKFQSYEVTDKDMPNKYELVACLEFCHLVGDLEAFGYTNDMSVLDRIVDLKDHLDDEGYDGVETFTETLIIPPIPMKAIYNDIMTF